jgi:hypothetical protein
VDEFGKWVGPGIYTKRDLLTWDEVKLRYGIRQRRDNAVNRGKSLLMEAAALRQQADGIEARK